MNIVILTPDFPPYSEHNEGMGGIATWLYETAEGITGCGHTCTVLCPRKERNAEAAFDSASSFETVRFKRFLWRHFRYLLLFRLLSSCIRKHEDNVFISGIGTLCHLPVFFSRFFSYRSATFVHGNDGLRIRKSAKLKKALARCGVIITNSSYTTGLVREMTDSRSTVLRMNTEKLAERLGMTDRKVLFTAGRLIERKNHLLVLEALRNIVAQYPEICYCIAGDGPYRSVIEKRVAEYGLRDHVIMTGFVSQKDLRSLYETADIFIMASSETADSVEGFGIVFLEANFFGTPVIGSRTGGIEDAVEDGINGLLVSPDSASELEQAILKLLDSPELRTELGKRGAERVSDTFSRTGSVKSLLNELLKEPSE